MKKHQHFLSCLIVGIYFLTAFGQTRKLPYQNPQLSIEQRGQDLLSRMTIEEKFWQLFMIPGDLSDGKEKYKHGIFGFQIAANRVGNGDAEQMLNYLKSGNAKKTAQMINTIQKFFREETRLGIPIIPFVSTPLGIARSLQALYFGACSIYRISRACFSYHWDRMLSRSDLPTTIKKQWAET